MIQCAHCAFPNPYRRFRCGRCGRPLHGPGEHLMVLVVVAAALLVGWLLFLR